MPKKLTNTAKRATSKGLGQKSPGFPGKLTNTAKRSTSKTTSPMANDRKLGSTTMGAKGQGAKMGKGRGSY